MVLLNMSAFRPIRPTTDSKEEVPMGQSGPQASGLESNVTLGKARKRRAPSNVSQNACTNCKKARAKVKQKISLPLWYNEDGK